MLPPNHLIIGILSLVQVIPNLFASLYLKKEH